MRIVLTRFLDITETRPSRIRAEVLAPGYKPATITYDHAWGFERNCRAAAEEVMRRNKVAWVVGESPAGEDKRGLYWVAAEA